MNRLRPDARTVGLTAALLAMRLVAGPCPALAEDPTPAGPPAAPSATPPAPAPPVVAPGAAKAAPEPAKGTPATVIDNGEIVSILGRAVRSPTGEDMGRIVDILVENTGTLRAAVIDFGGFFGVGSRKIAVDWRSLHFLHDAKGDRIVTDMPRNQLRVAPVYKEGEPVVVLEPTPEATTAARAADAPQAASPAPGSAPAPDPAPK